MKTGKFLFHFIFLRKNFSIIRFCLQVPRRE